MKMPVCKISDEKRKETVGITEKGNPRKPTGKYGELMLDGMNEHHGPLTEWGLSFLQNRAFSALLDIGCGGGATLKRLAMLAPDSLVTGLDYSKTSVQKSKDYNADLIREGRVKVIQGSVSSMPFETDSFDGITTVESFYFWPDPQNDLKEVLRILRPGSSFLLIADIYGGYDFNEETLTNIRQFDLFNPTPDEFRRLFLNAGFAKVNIHLKDGTSWICAEGVK